MILRFVHESLFSLIVADLQSFAYKIHLIIDDVYRNLIFN